MSGTGPRASTARGRPAIIAHRGASASYAEHTRAAYLAALDDRSDGVECDVRLTADGHLVLWHDDDVERTSDGVGQVHRMTLEQLRRLDVSSWFGMPLPARYGTVAEQLLTLDDLLDLLLAAGRPLTLALEVKHPNPLGTAVDIAVLDLLDRRGWDARRGTLATLRISLMSFNPASILVLAPRVSRPVVMLLADAEPDVPVDASDEEAARIRTAYAQGLRMLDDGVVGGAGPSLRLLRAEPDRVATWRRAGLLLRVWTVDSRSDVDLCVSAGVQEITTNRPLMVRGRLGLA